MSLLTQGIGDFFRLLIKLFMGSKLFWANMGELFCMGFNDQSDHARKEESFTNTFSSNLNSVNLKIFADHGGRHI